MVSQKVQKAQPLILPNLQVGVGGRRQDANHFNGLFESRFTRRPVRASFVSGYYRKPLKWFLTSVQSKLNPNLKVGVNETRPRFGS